MSSRNTWVSAFGFMWILLALTGCGGNNTPPVQPGMTPNGNGVVAGGNLPDTNPGENWYTLSDQAKRQVYYSLVGALSGQRQAQVQAQTVVDYQTYGNTLQPQPSQPSNAVQIPWVNLNGQPAGGTFYLTYADSQYQVQLSFVTEFPLPGTRLFSTNQVALFAAGDPNQGQFVVAKVPVQSASPQIQIFFVSMYPGGIMHVLSRTLGFGGQPQYTGQPQSGYPYYR